MVGMKKKSSGLDCLEEPLSQGMYSLHPPDPLGPPLPGHLLILPDCPHSPLGQLGVVCPARSPPVP